MIPKAYVFLSLSLFMLRVHCSTLSTVGGRLEPIQDAHMQEDVTEECYHQMDEKAPVDSSSLDNLQSFFNGIWSANNLTTPSALIDCFDVDTAQNMTSMVENALSLGLLGKFEALQKAMTPFMHSFSSDVLSCLKSSNEFKQLQDALGLSNQPVSVRMSQLGFFIIENPMLIREYIAKSSMSFLAGNHGEIGMDFVKVLQSAFATNN